jgi:hypothetical protein
MSSRLGTIFANYAIQCAECEYIEQLGAGTRKEAVDIASSRGWLCRSSLGYVCPDCHQQKTEVTRKVTN